MTLASIFGVIIIFQGVLNFLVLSGGNHRKKTNLWFAGMNTSLIIWILTIVFANFNFSEYIISLIINKLAFVSIFSFTFFLFFFAESFSNVSIKIPKILSGYILTSTIFWVSITLFTNEVVKGLIRVEDRFDIDRDGSLYLIFLIFTLLHLFISIVLLAIKTWKAESKEKSKLRVVLWGLVIISVIIVLTNAVIPKITGTTESSDYGPLAIIIWLTVIYYNIRVNQFLDAKILIGRLVYYFIIGLFSYTAYYFFSFITISLFGSIYTPGSYILGILNSAIFVLVFDSARKFFQDQINIRFINPGFDPKEALNNYNTEISTVLDNTRLSNVSLELLTKTLRANYEGIVLNYNNNGNPELLSKESKEGIDLNVLKEAFIIWEHAGEIPINLDHIDIQLQNEFRNMKSWLDPIVAEMKKNGLHLLVPLKLVSEERYIGFILMGGKEGDTGFDSVEVGFIKSIAESLSSALARSELHKEVQDLNANLQKKVEEATDELQQKVVALEEARRRERDMLDILGHELRTPLTIVRNAIQMMQVADGAGSLTQEMVKEYLEMADENAKREVSLLETMLTTTKIDNDSLSLLLTKVLLNDVVSDTFAALTQKAERKGLKLLKGEIQDEVFVYADRDRFQEVVDNITDNAVKYTDHGEVKVSIYKDGDNMAVVKVEDTGIGIPKDKIAFLGQKFYRVGNYLDNGNTDMSIVRPGGTGLGLYVVFELAKAMGGRIEVESEMGKGSIFTIYIPLYTGQENKQIGGKKVTVYEKFKELKKKKKSDTEKERTEESAKEERGE